MPCAVAWHAPLAYARRHVEGCVAELQGIILGEGNPGSQFRQVPTNGNLMVTAKGTAQVESHDDLNTCV